MSDIPTPLTDAAFTSICHRISSDGFRYSEEHVPAEFARGLERKLAEAKDQLDAWHSQFGTSQLSHAVAEMDQLKREITALNSELSGQNRAEAGGDF